MESRRPRFLLGERLKPMLEPVRPELPRPPIQQPTRIIRPSLRKIGPRPVPLRTIKDIEEERTRQFGVRVRLGEKGPGKIKVKKRDTEGNVILDEEGQPIFEERDIDLEVLADILSSGTKENIDKLAQLGAQISAGVATSREDRENIMLRLLRVVEDLDTLRSLTSTQFGVIGQAIAAAKIPSSPAQSGITNIIDGRFITRAGWDADGGANRGNILLFLMGNSRNVPGLSIDHPILGFSGRPVTLSTLLNVMGRGTSAARFPVLDLVDQRLYPNLATAREVTGVRATPREAPPAFDEKIPEFVTPTTDIPRGLFETDDDVLSRLQRQADELKHEEEEARRGALTPAPQPAGPFIAPQEALDVSDLSPEELADLIRSISS